MTVSNARVDHFVIKRMPAVPMFPEMLVVKAEIVGEYDVKDDMGSRGVFDLTFRMEVGSDDESLLSVERRAHAQLRALLRSLVATI